MGRRRNRNHGHIVVASRARELARILAFDDDDGTTTGRETDEGVLQRSGHSRTETGLVELKGRMSRRARKGGTGVPPDAWDEDGEGGGLPPAFCGGSLPEGVLFGGHQTK